ncbi:MAG: branched-chain amino acid ABC transporter ATP-binding protein/permease [Candidatus Nanopelagicales bacterium]
MGYYAQVAIDIMILMTLAASLNLLLGYAGRVSMAQALLFGIGAFTAARLVLPPADADTATNVSGIGYGFGWPWYLAVIGAIVVTFIAALIISLPAVRLVRGEYLILLTLAFQLGGQQIMNVATALTGGPFGVAGVPSIKIGDISLSSLKEEGAIRLAIFMLIVTVIVIAVCWAIGESPFGRLLKTLREHESVVASVGKNPVRPELLTFGITAAIAGGMGAFFAFSQGAMTPVNFNLDLSILIVSVVVLGGVGNLLGTVVGALILGLMEPFLRVVLGGDAIPWRTVVYGGALVLMMMVRPAGLIPEGSGRNLFRRKRATGVDMSPAQAMERLSRISVASGQEDRAVLEVVGLKKSFGGLVAVGGASFTITEGKITALIGPNGAGKTTIFNMITGTLKPDEGQVLLNGIDITGEPAVKVARRGIARSFQDVRISERMTVLDNVMMAVPNQPGESLGQLAVRPFHTRKVDKATKERALECLALFGVSNKAYMRAGDLSYGDQKLAAIARLLATDCDVLLLDEPTSGVDPANVEGVMLGVSRLRDLGRTVCLVEHSVHFVQQLADRAVFLDQGIVLAEGTVDELTNKQELTDLYFGS